MWYHDFVISLLIYQGPDHFKSIYYFLQDFIKQCLEKNQASRPTARELLFHTVLFEVHSLKLLAAHSFIKNASKFVQLQVAYFMT